MCLGGIIEIIFIFRKAFLRIFSKYSYLYIQIMFYENKKFYIFVQKEQCFVILRSAFIPCSNPKT